MDLNTKKIKKNAFRVTKVRGLTASRVRVPGGHLQADLLGKIQEISQIYGNGSVHITTRQGFEIPGIKYEDIDKVNELLQPIIESLGINQEIPGKGYTSAGTRNVSACIGNNVCPFANYNTTNFAKRIEKAIFPNDLHFKVALTGCPNDCIKARMHDFGIIGMTEPQYDKDRCVSCGACVRACKKKSVDALKAVNYKIVRNEEKCIGCGECVINCPTGAWTRSKEKYYKLVIMGRSGKRNPRLAEDFLIWADEQSIIKIILNTYKFVDMYIDKSAPGGKEHIGYIIDRVGFEEYKKWALEGIEFPEKTIVKQCVYWNGVHF
ncbi:MULTISPECIES: sulfite reductase subunit C [unclassified Clostridium]|uniref:sulfite reductase subunit C n=1 Tax=unclassified Clostridium TaxID=2614128 RepID=UPI0013FC47DE|nr:MULTISPECIES: sulfite reductase subunit C [unclassified Clostridium]NFN93896.1 sulfite reductase subunit C [Clostridium botulinum]NFR85300.1 sulfite reductase subunit C [Clostridium botulinum]NFR89585.1 sulfite reductase subunit C [Clostridium botulinum]NFS94954.1 sulfite reductase subunit C [Clostridium botulinum]NFT05516.1 sulfite reductase subunit C [Clostridium botulinum]